MKDSGEGIDSMQRKNLLKELSRYKIGTWADIIYRNALLYPTKEAFVYENKRITFSEYNINVNKLTNTLLDIGVKKGDVIGILSWNCLEYAYIYGAAMKGGFIASPFNARLRIKEFEYIIKYSKASALFIGPELFEIASALKPDLTGVKHYISLERPAPGMLALDDILPTRSEEEPDVQV
jgi:acyl-CoA synthetase (AMP-forming)/AMP-acid ligase II